ncbi:MAG: hypothetical protein IKN54_01830 [Lachnospiraceae bacterium]|nr:hypothetical protein [Lachnospiraceae bacterium]
MVDIHSHILPMLDDGSGSFEETIEMLSIAQHYNVRHIVASSHGNMEQYPYEVERYKEAFKRLQDKIRHRDMRVRIYPGMEIMLGDDTSVAEVISKLKSGQLLTINDTDYVLVEVPFTVSTRYITEHTQPLIDAGYKVILAHPERYHVIKARPERAEELVGSGLILQVNAGSIADVFGRECRQAALQMLDMDMAQIIATDAHDTRRRSHNMNGAMDMLESRYDDDMIHMWLSENPSRVLKGMELLHISDIR